MPVFTVKKTREDTDQVETVEMNVPNEVFNKILFMLDGRSLHTARQVSKEWNSLIQTQVLGTVEGRREMERTLQHQWREATPAKLEFTIGDLTNPRVLTLTDKFAVISDGSDLSWKPKINVVNTREEAVVMKLSCSGRFPAALISKDVLLVATGGEFLAWNIHTKEKIFGKEYSTIRATFAHHNQQVIVGQNTRLQIMGTTVIETNLAPLPESTVLLSFSHPHYVTRRDSGGDFTLWKLDGTELARVGGLEYHGVGSPVFCPPREILVFYSRLHPYSENIKLTFFSSQTGDLIKVRVLTVPTDFTISDLQMNGNQLVVWIRQQVLVYDLDCLLSQAADQQIAPKVFQIGQPCDQGVRIYLDKTSVYAGLKRGNTVKFTTIDFWNCQN